MVVYFISGLGADERAFQRIRLPAGYQIQHIPWEPVKGNETIEAYARQLAKKIDSSKPFMLAGLSFGGLLAVEISKLLKPEKLILFSTVETREELPAVYRLAGRFRVYKLLPHVVPTYALRFLYWFFGPLDQDGRNLIAAFQKQTDPLFLRWALMQISRWQNNTSTSSRIHIHGSRDRTFPVRLTHANYVVEGSGHLCVFTSANEVNKILEKELSVQI